jgi:hypothetical protein
VKECERALTTHFSSSYGLPMDACEPRSRKHTACTLQPCITPPPPTHSPTLSLSHSLSSCHSFLLIPLASRSPSDGRALLSSRDYETLAPTRSQTITGSSFLDPPTHFSHSRFTLSSFRFRIYDSTFCLMSEFFAVAGSQEQSHRLLFIGLTSLFTVMRGHVRQ